jgi:hypothetical protein
MGIYSLIFRGAPGIGGLVAGAASVHLGLRWPVIAGAAAVIGTTVCIFSRYPQIVAALPNPEAEPVSSQKV